MGPRRLLGFALIIIGTAMIAMGGFSFNQKKKVLDTDVVDITTTEKKSVSWPAIAGVVVGLAGIVVLLTAPKKV